MLKVFLSGLASQIYAVLDVPVVQGNELELSVAYFCHVLHCPCGLRLQGCVFSNSTTRPPPACIAMHSFQCL